MSKAAGVNYLRLFFRGPQELANLRLSILLNSTLDIVDLSFYCMNGSLGYGIVIRKFIFLWCMRSCCRTWLVGMYKAEALI